MRLEFNWTANQKRAKCVEIFDAIVEQVLSDHRLDQRHDGVVRMLIGEVIRGKRWMRATYAVNSSDSVKEKYAEGLPELVRKSNPDMEHLIESLTFSNFIEVFGKCTVTMGLLPDTSGYCGTADIHFRTIDDEQITYHDPDADVFDPEATGGRLELQLANLVVLFQAVECHRYANSRSLNNVQTLP